jgi:3D-(3,5/4)-trihydroxycyclohexane-1,2-dione acylhydrolase (decyclizing)
MTIGGSKGSLPGNYSMEHADLLIAVGTRAVCQSDCSRTGYPNVKRVININADMDDVTHYNHTLALVGDVRRTLEKLNQALGPVGAEKKNWLAACADKKAEWQSFKQQRILNPVLLDDYWGGPVLTQPAAIKIAADWAKRQGAVCFFDAGDVQANGFQIVEDERPDQTFTETGASYMGFAVSALLATGITAKPFYGLALTGDGSFTMNPQILIDGAEHGARGCILLLDNGRMGAITGLQEAQYGQGFATWNNLHVDYLVWARAVPGLLALDQQVSEFHQGRDHGIEAESLDALFDHPDDLAQLFVRGIGDHHLQPNSHQHGAVGAVDQRALLGRHRVGNI